MASTDDATPPACARGADFAAKPLFMVTRRHQPCTQADCPLLIERVDAARPESDGAGFARLQRQGLRQLHQEAARMRCGAPFAAPDPSNARFPQWFASLPSRDVADAGAYHAPFRHPHKCKETRALEREERRRRMDQEDWRRKTQAKFMRQLLSHREEVMKRGRATRADAARCARGCKQKLEKVERSKEADESRTARRRLQALRANDMTSYAKLVEEAKNHRLKFLLEQTDGYIRQITKQVSSLRQAEEGLEQQAAKSGDAPEEKKGASTAIDDDDDSKKRDATRDYYNITHAVGEEVRQPKCLTGGRLKEYQLAGLTWLVSLHNNRLNGILADEMGLGKTIQTIALLAHLLERGVPGPFLVVAPLSTLSNWSQEFAKWAPAMTVLPYKGPPAARKEAQKELASLYTNDAGRGRRGAAAAAAARESSKQGSRQLNVLLTTYEYVMRDRAVLRRVGWEYIVVDEGHRMKNASSKFAQTLGTMYTAKRRLLLTGTPLQNSLPELWALLNFLLPTIFSSVDTFEDWFNKPFSNMKATEDEASVELAHEERMLVIHRLHEVLRPFVLRRVKSAVLGQLPEKVEKVLRVDLTAWQQVLYEQIRSSGVHAKQEKGSNTAPVSRGLNNVLMQLRKVCNHPFLFRSDAWTVDESLIRSSGKFLLLDAMLPKLKAAGHRILLFSQMTALMDLLEDFFRYRRFEFLRLDGSTQADEREKRMANFNDPSSPAFVFLLSTRAGGLGLNLASADTVIIFDSDWNPMMDAQAQDRAHRIGQKNDVRVFRLCSTSPVEERILQRATDKLNMNSLVVEAGQFSKDSKADDRRQMVEDLLREYKDEEPEEESSSIKDDLFETMASSNDEITLYRTVDARRAATGEALAPYDSADVPEWVRAGRDGADEAARLRAETSSRARSDFGDFSGDPSQRRARAKKRDYAGMSDRSFLKLLQEGPTALYEPVGTSDGAMRVRLKRRRP